MPGRPARPPANRTAGIMAELRVRSGAAARLRLPADLPGLAGERRPGHPLSSAADRHSDALTHERRAPQNDRSVTPSRAGRTSCGRCRTADTCVPYVGPVATVRDGRRRAASADRSRHGEHPSARVSVAKTLIGRACQQPRFAVSDVRCSRRMTRVTGWPGSGRRLAGPSVVAEPGAGMFASCRFPASMRSVA
jgi:hypothetical protein